MSSLASHCGVVRVVAAVHWPYGALPLLYAGTKTQLVCQLPWYFTQCPAVMTVLAFWLVTALPVQEAVRPWKVKNTRPEVLTTSPPPVHGPPACGKEGGAAVGSTVVDGPSASGAFRRLAACRVSSRSSGVASRIRSAVQKARETGCA